MPDTPTITLTLRQKPLRVTPDEALSLRGQINAALRSTHGGGRPVSCECGTCAACIRRMKRRAAKLST